MTTKDFLYRVQRFAALDECVVPFFEEKLTHVYRISCLSQNVNHVVYWKTPTLDCFGDSIKSVCDSIYIDRFTFSEFLVQYKYFKSFYWTISKSQRECLCRFGNCDHLIERVALEKI